MTEEANQPVSTGFEAIAPAAAASPPTSIPEAEAPPVAPTVQPSAEGPPAVVEAAPATLTEKVFAPKPDEFINIANAGPVAPQSVAETNKALFDKIMASRNQPPAVVHTQPVAPRMLEQTKREMEEGARQIARAKAQQLAQGPRKIDTSGGTTTTVMRPASTVPGMNSLTDAQRGVRNL